MPEIKTTTTIKPNTITIPTTAKNAGNTAKEFIFNNNGEKISSTTTTTIKTTAILENVDTTKSTIVTEKVIDVANEANNMFQHGETTSEIQPTTTIITTTTRGTTSMLEIQPTLKPMMQSKSIEQIEETYNEKETTVKPLAPTTTITIINEITTRAENEKIEKLPEGKQENEYKIRADNLVPPAVEHELLLIATAKSITTLPPITLATNIPVIDKENDKIMITHSELAAEQTTKVEPDEHVLQMLHIPSATSVTAPTTTITLPGLTTFNTKELNKDINFADNGILSSKTTPTPTAHPPTVSTTLNMDIMLSDQQHEEVEGHGEEKGGLRLLDLEKQERKSQQRKRKEKQLKQKHQSQPGADVLVDDFDGHDGVKKIKKKQLQIDEHLLADIGMMTRSTSKTTTTMPTKSSATKKPTSTQKPKTNLDINVEKTSTKVKKVEKKLNVKLLSTVTDFPTHSLGPIHMDEKIYNIREKQRNFPLVKQHEIHSSHDNKKPILKAHTTSLAQQKPMEQNSHTPGTENPTEATKKYLTEQTESKISDIQVEIYDSTIDSIVASTSFKDNKNANGNSNTLESLQTTTKTPPVATLQERFTQYVIDRVESSTQESNLLPEIVGGFGNPEPAAIEIHINVSEGIGNGSEDLEFSYPQTNFEPNESLPKSASKEAWKTIGAKNSKLNETKNYANGEEVLLVEIIDANDNSTDNSVSNENIHPVFTFRTDQSVNEIEFKDVAKESDKSSSAQRTDELFMADVKHFSKIPVTSVSAPHAQRSSMDRDSDTIFYISNTEVKVGESLPTSNTDIETFHSPQKIQNYSGYTLSTHPNLIKANSQRRYEEDILLSPLQNTADSLKIFRSQNDGDAPPLDVTYVGESVMEVEQLPSSEKGQNDISILTQVTTTTTSTPAPGHVIIQPATLSEIGVPVIGELPPQIELKEFDFMPDELTNHEQRSGGVSGAEEESGHVDEEQPLVGNDVERLVESSIQYGGDLIDEGAVDTGGGFDGAEGSYPFGNLATMGRHGKQNAKRKHGAHLNVNHGVNNLRKDELSVDVGGAVVGAAFVDDAASIHLNSTLKDAEIGMHNVSDTIMNITFAVAERMTNATTASVMEDPKRKSLNVNEECKFNIQDFHLLYCTVENN